MAIKNYHDERITDYALNDNFSALFCIQGLNYIRTLIDRSVKISAGQQDCWGDAYVVDSGRMGTDVGATTTATFDLDKYKFASTGLITHSIQSGTFGATINSAIGVALIEDWEAGADIKYKLTNATEDTGWLDCGTSPKVSSFTAFSSQPTKLVVQLIPKTVGPTPGYPSINGFFILAR